MKQLKRVMRKSLFHPWLCGWRTGHRLLLGFSLGLVANGITVAGVSVEEAAAETQGSMLERPGLL